MKKLVTVFAVLGLTACSTSPSQQQLEKRAQALEEFCGEWRYKAANGKLLKSMPHSCVAAKVALDKSTNNISV